MWPGEVTLAPGATLYVGARVQGTDAVPTLVFRSLARERRIAMDGGAPPAGAHAGGANGTGATASDPGGEGSVYQAAVAAVSSPGEYAVEVAGRRSPAYRVTLAGGATPVSFAVTYRYPAYTRLPAETQAAARADLVALKGTRATVAVNLDRRVEAATWTLGTPLRRDGERRWVGETTVDRDRSYELVLRSTGREERFAFRTEAVPDRPPFLVVVLPAGDLDLPAGQRIPIAISASDDFGLSDLRLVYESQRAAAGEGGPSGTDDEGGPSGGNDARGPSGTVALARWGSEPREATTRTEWDAGPLGLLPGQSAAFFLEVRDNDRVSGPKVTRSARFVVRFPTLSEVYERIEERQAGAAEQLGKALQEARELAKQVEEVRRDLQQNPRDRRAEASWEKRQSAVEAAERQQEISGKLEEVTRQIEDAARQAAERQALREDLLAKMQEIAKLVAELQTPELREAIRRLQESLRQVDPRHLEANLRQLASAQEELLKGLERTLELLRRVRQEERLDAAARRAEELAKREEAIERQMRDAGRAGERERLAAAQEQAARDSDDLRADLERLARELNESREVTPAEEARQGAETLQQEAQPALQQSAREMRESQPSAARRSAARARQSFSQVAERLRGAARSMSDEVARRLAEAVRRSAQDLVDLSQRQEDALREGGDPRRRAQRQQDLREGAERVADDLVSVAKRTPFLPPDAQRSLGQALERLGRAEQSFTGGAADEGERQARAASSAFNQAVVGLRQAEKAMCQGGSQSGGQSPSPQSGQPMKTLTGQQGELNQDTQSLIERLTRQQRLVAGDQEALEHLAARQEAIRRGIDEALDQQREGELLGRLDEAKREMEEVARQLRDRRLDDVPDRQNRVLSRLLDAQRSVNRREFDERRQSRPGEDVARASPADLPEALTEGRERAQRDLLRARAERYPSEYRDLVESYLRKLQESP